MRYSKTIGQVLTAFVLSDTLTKKATALAPPSTPTTTTTTRMPTVTASTTRRLALEWLVGGTSSAMAAGFATGTSVPNQVAHAVDTEDFIRTGMVSMPMGVSGQAGKAKPITGVIFREGTDVSRNARSGDVLAEILVKNNNNNKNKNNKIDSDISNDLLPVVTTFSSPWPLATGNVFDIECRDGDTGDAVFVAVTPSVGGKDLDQLNDSFFTQSIFGPTGRFSMYGQPTDIKVKTVAMKDNYRVLDVSFSTLSQSTQTEIPRKAKVVATIPTGASQAVMLIASTSALRWKKGADKVILTLAESFKATPAPQTGLKVRAREQASSIL